MTLPSRRRQQCSEMYLGCPKKREEDLPEDLLVYRELEEEMGENEDLAKTNRSRTLLVRHLPAELNQDEKEELLKYFGAESVRVFSTRGRLKHAAFATFKSEKMAAKALSRLHQLQILNQTLIVEFASGQDNFTVLKDPPVSDGYVFPVGKSPHPSYVISVKPISSPFFLMLNYLPLWGRRR
ncbi:hypothetical protein GOODEAATRI_026309 [Goodea atripinnis]|uniref:RNA-binding region-containing protein 3 n=1 Tax=Goodea atripinnis TaxID=208336 RepID=A0ABV0P7X8_9TELE